MGKQKLTPVEKMIAGKKKLIVRLHKDIRDVQDQANVDIGKIRARSAIAKSLLGALESGSLKV